MTLEIDIQVMSTKAGPFAPTGCCLAAAGPNAAVSSSATAHANRLEGRIRIVLANPFVTGRRYTAENARRNSALRL